jgi:hypothetical protein
MGRTISLWISASFIVYPLASWAAEAGTGGGRQLTGLKCNPAWVSRMACINGCAKYLKLDAPPAWIFGASGNAFALNIFVGELCPSGPTAWPEEKCDALMANAGLHIKALSTYKQDPNAPEHRREMFKLVQAAIDAGRPCLGWEMDIPEWYPICGYDQAGNYLFIDFDGKVRAKNHRQHGQSEIGVASVLILEPCKPADDRKTVRDALVLALNIAAGKCAWKRYAGGLAGYDEWIRGLDANSTGGLGAAYNAQCWAECRREAVAFLKLAAKRLPDAELAAEFKQAIDCYSAVSQQLDAVAKDFPFDQNDSKAMDAHWADKHRRAKAAEALRKTRKAEREGLEALARIAVALGAKDIHPGKLNLPE